MLAVMNIRLRLAVLAITLLVSNAAWPDQRDPRLDELFLRLQFSEEPQQISLIENDIWEIWLQHENPDVERLLAAGTARMNSGAFAQALSIYSQLIDSFPDFAEAWNKRATLYYVLEDYEASIADIEATLALEPRHFGALSGLGLVYVQQGKLNAAEEAFARLLEVHPNSRSAQENMQRLQEQMRLNVI